MQIHKIRSLIRRASFFTALAFVCLCGMLAFLFQALRLLENVGVFTAVTWISFILLIMCGIVFAIGLFFFSTKSDRIMHEDIQRLIEEG